MPENVDLGYGNTVEVEGNNCQKSVNHQIQFSESKFLKLKFLKPVRDLVYTGIPIGGGDASPEIALIDIPTGNIVKSGSEASANVEFFVLNNSFSKDDRDDDWTSKEFEDNILPGRHGKSSLLGKRTHAHLNEGLGSLKDISFSHSRNPLPKTYVRLGARVVDSSGGIRIREAVSNLFVVKDRRGMKKKDRPISCNDEVWRLENIGKDGPSHKNLLKENINSIKDFLAIYKEDPGKLYNILEKTMRPGKLETTINHAKTCEDKDEVSDNMRVADFKSRGEDSVVDSSSDPILVFDYDGSKISDSMDSFGPLLDILRPAESMHGWGFLGGGESGDFL